MAFTKAFIPYGGYYSTPFVKWNGSLKAENPNILAADTALRWFKEKQLDTGELDFLYYGATTANPISFYAHVYAAAVISERKKEIPALSLNQVCATSATTLALAAGNIELNEHETIFCLSTDRMSSTPIIVTPEPNSGSLVVENIVLDNFKRDPSPGAGLAMYQTAEAVAKEKGITRELCDEVTALRYQQYAAALADDRAFQKKYMFPVELKNKKGSIFISEDEGVRMSTLADLRALKTIEAGGVLTFGSQTHPADGNAGILVTTKDKAKHLSQDATVQIQIVSSGIIRMPGGRMAGALPVALTKALERADIDVTELKHIKTHNPFIVNDINLAITMNIPEEKINNCGCSMVYGHPQGPTAARAIIELIELLVRDGGGYGAFAGCAAGDLGVALVIKVG